MCIFMEIYAHSMLVERILQQYVDYNIHTQQNATKLGSKSKQKYKNLLELYRNSSIHIQNSHKALHGNA